MKAAIIFTGGGPVLFLTSYSSLDHPGFIEKLEGRGIKKFIAYEIDIEKVRPKYGTHFEVVMNDVKETDDLRCLDYNGFNVFYNFSLKELGNPVYHEP
ncbi:MAG: hypothetical protein V1689_13025 [Pseudomonadota bacterium]